MSKKVIVYSTPTCSHCIHAKQYLKEKGIEYVEYNVAEDQEARAQMLEKTGRMAVPMIMVDDEVVVGFDKAKLESLLA